MALITLLLSVKGAKGAKNAIIGTLGILGADEPMIYDISRAIRLLEEAEETLSYGHAADLPWVKRRVGIAVNDLKKVYRVLRAEQKSSSTKEQAELFEREQ